MTIKPGSIVEILGLGPEPLEPRHRDYFAPGTQHRVISYDPEFWEVELINPDNNSEKPTPNSLDSKLICVIFFLLFFFFYYFFFSF